MRRHPDDAVLRFLAGWDTVMGCLGLASAPTDSLAVALQHTTWFMWILVLQTLYLVAMQLPGDD